MAAVSAVIPSPSTSRPFSSRGNLYLRSILSFRCSASPQENGASTPQLLKLAVSGVTEHLRVLSPNKTRDEDWRSEDVAEARSVDDVVQILRSDYHNSYFLTGKFTSDIYAEDCLFEDPTIKFRQHTWPLISIRGATTCDLDKNFKIVRHAESWTVSALEAVGQKFSLGSKGENTVVVKPMHVAEKSHAANGPGCLRVVQHPSVFKPIQLEDERREST